jgi:hypothetical protein
MPPARRVVACALVALGVALPGAPLYAAQFPVRHREGTTHGFIVLRPPGGEILATGELIQTVTGEHVTSELTLHFKDGSMHEETTEYLQGAHFRLLSDRLRQLGPSFPNPQEVRIDAVRGTVTIHSLKDANEKPVEKHVTMPADIANGLIVTLLKNLAPSQTEATATFLVASSRPRVVKLEMHAAGQQRFSADGLPVTANHYVVHVNIGGIVGKVASLMGKQPPDMDFWVTGGKAPAFLKFSGPLCEDGPVWSIELAAPREEGKEPRR